ncbi:hypothetical protein G6F32_014882 [Rhizopus arrhizus]|nr:hypothetical protein G6F32_014882 [Rhizopus arrhizus]
MCSQRSHDADPGSPYSAAARTVRRHRRSSAWRHRMISDVRTAVRPLMLAAALSTAALSLTACAPLIVGGAAATTAVVVTDRRTSGIQLEDQNMAFKAQSQISQKLGDTARVNAMAYGGHLLLTGDVPTEEAKSQATAIAQGVENVKQVINQLNVGPIASTCRPAPSR